MIVIITSRAICPEPLPERLRKIAPAKPDLVVLREPDLTDAQYRALALECLGALSPHSVPLAVHSRPAIAAELGVKWLWTPFAERGANTAGANTAGTAKIVSVHNAAEAVAAAEAGARYVVAGNIYRTPCKPGAPARGLRFLRGIVRASPIPVLAIGGINRDNFRDCIAAGAAGVCIMTSAMTFTDTFPIPQ